MQLPELIGRTLTEVSHNARYMLFVRDDGKRFRIFHSQD